MTDKVHRRNICFTKSGDSDLQRVAEEFGISYSEAVRLGLATLVQLITVNPPTQKQVTLITSHDTNI